MAGETFEIDGILSSDDARRARQTLQKLLRHNVGGWALAGGLAAEIHCRRRGEACSSNRPLNDLDFLAPGFDCVPESLSADFVFRHVHPHDPPGKTILQLIDVESRLRVDVFRSYGGILARAQAVQLPSGPVSLISAADVVARAARILLPLRDQE